jgi:predicted naringenin-chalcone synthase
MHKIVSIDVLEYYSDSISEELLESSWEYLKYIGKNTYVLVLYIYGSYISILVTIEVVK